MNTRSVHPEGARNVYYVERRRHPGRVPSLTIPSNANRVSVRSEEVGGGMPYVAIPKRLLSAMKTFPVSA